MVPIVLEWDVLFQLFPSVNDAGTSPGLAPLDFNELVSIGTTPLGYFLLDPSKCQAGAARRITRNNLAQADGEITHRKFKSGYVFELNCQLWSDPASDPACAGTLRQMADVLGEYLEAVANNDGQLVWFPSTWPEGSLPAANPRLLDQCRSMGPSGNESGGTFVSVVTEKDEGAKLYDVTFALLSKFPYVTDFMDYPTSPDATVTLSSASAPGWCDTGLGFVYTEATVVNAGNAAYSPVIRIYGPFTGFNLSNLSVEDEIGNALSIIYDSTLPGAIAVPSGSYLEIDTFTNLAIVHNPGGGTDNGKPGIDPTMTDYFQLEPGANQIGLCLLGGPTAQPAEIIYRNAWV